MAQEGRHDHENFLRPQCQRLTEPDRYKQQHAEHAQCHCEDIFNTGERIAFRPWEYAVKNEAGIEQEAGTSIVIKNPNVATAEQKRPSTTVKAGYLISFWRRNDPARQNPNQDDRHDNRADDLNLLKDPPAPVSDAPFPNQLTVEMDQEIVRARFEA